MNRCLRCDEALQSMQPVIPVEMVHGWVDNNVQTTIPSPRLFVHVTCPRDF